MGSGGQMAASQARPSVRRGSIERLQRMLRVCACWRWPGAPAERWRFRRV